MQKCTIIEIIEGYKRVIDKIINSDSCPLPGDLVMLSMEMQQKLDDLYQED